MPDGPGASIRLAAARPHLAVDADQPGGDAEPVHRLAEAVDAIALGYAGEVEPERRPLARPPAGRIEFEGLEGEAMRGLAGRRAAPGIGAEAPGGHQIADADVEGAVRGFADGESRLDHRDGLGRQLGPGADRRRVEPAEIGVPPVGRHLPVDLVHRRLKSGPEIVVPAEGLAMEHGDQRAPMVGAAQRELHGGISRHLRHSVHPT